MYLLFIPNKLVTFVDVYDVGMMHWAHDLHFASDAHQIRLGLDFALLDGFDGHLLAGFLINT